MAFFVLVIAVIGRSNQQEIFAYGNNTASSISGYKYKYSMFL